MKHARKLLPRILFLQIAVVLSCMFGTPLYGQDYGFDRLFTSAQERKELQSLRNVEPEPEIIIDGIEDSVEAMKIVPRRDMQSLTIDGFLYRQDGMHAVWINKQAMYQSMPNSTSWQINRINVQGKAVSIGLPLEGLEFILKVGETYRPKGENGFDIIGPADGIAISKQ